MSPDQNPYEFITDPSQIKKSSGFNFMKNPNQRTIFGIVFVIVAVIIVVAVFGAISNLNSKDVDKLAAVSAYQTEIIRVSNLGLKESNDPDVLAKISTLKAFLFTDLSETKSTAINDGTQLSPVQLASAKDPRIDTVLQSASLNNAFDEELISIIEALSDNYVSSLQQAFNEDPTAEEKRAILKTAGDNILIYKNSFSSES